MSVPPAHASHESLVKSALAAASARTDDFLHACLAALPDSPPRLTESVAYSLFGPGKRIRPALVILCCQAIGGNTEIALPPAAAIEMIHCFSLIHDDLPAMDNDDLRRGRPTNHKVYGDALAILAGDALNTLAFEIIARKIADPALAAKLILELASATGMEGMIGGQVLDTCHPEESKRGGAGAKSTLADLQRIHRMKTGALLRCSCRMGALAGNASPEQLQLLDTYGKAIGLAFQIMDDILDVTATEEQMGKKTGKDAAIGKLTYPSLIGLEESRKHLAQQVAVTDDVCNRLGAGGGRAETLRALSHYMANRTH
jgi:geranylgeranyl diphosphate synthase, type II